MVDETLCPPNEERDRNVAGMEAYEKSDNSGSSGRGEAITNDDPRSEYTYGEFPFESFDSLVDRALDFLPRTKEEEEEEDRRGVGRTMVDLGSGCGRLMFYAALTRGGVPVGRAEDSFEESTDDATTKAWNVHGVEIGTRLHSLAVNSLQRGVDGGCFSYSNDIISDEGSGSGVHPPTVMAFHNGNALPIEDPYYAPSSARSDEEIRTLLSETDLLFAYSTVWETNAAQPFHPEMGAMILSPKWSATLAELCPKGCVAITTDRALDPNDGWKLMDRMDVENPSVWGSVGYISVLEK